MNFRNWFETQGVAPGNQGPKPLTEAEEAIMVRMAEKVVEWKMTVPAIMFLESVKPLNYIGAQTMIFFEPFVQTIFNFKEYDLFREMVERRENVERLLLKIEEIDAEALDREREDRIKRRAARGRRWWWPFGGRSKKDQASGDPPTPKII